MTLLTGRTICHMVLFLKTTNWRSSNYWLPAPLVGSYRCNHPKAKRTGSGLEASGRGHVVNREYPSGTRRAVAVSVTPSASSLRSVVAAVRRAATPPAAACARSVAPERGAPETRAAPAFADAHVVATAVFQPGGDPAPPIGSRHASTAARTNAAGRRVAAAEPPASARLLRRARRGRMAPRCAITAGSPRGIGATGDEPPAERGHRCAPLADSFRSAGPPARTAWLRSSSGRLPLRRADRSGVCALR